MASKGVSGKRKLNVRTPEERAAIVAESFEAGATVAGVARRHGVQPNHLSSWRSKTQRSKEASGTDDVAIFAEVEVAADAPVRDCAEGIEIITGPVVIRLPATMSAKRIVEIAAGLAHP